MRRLLRSLLVRVLGQAQTPPRNAALRLEALEQRVLLSADLLGYAWPGEPDFHFQVYDRFGAPLSDLHWGDTIAVRYGIENAGDVDAGSYKVDFILSTDATIGNSDDYPLYDVHNFNRAIETGLRAGHKTKRTHQLSLPGAPPAGFTADDSVCLGMWVDVADQVPEGAGEGNNYDLGVGIDKRGPLLVGAPLPAWSISDVSVTEGDSGSAEAVFTLAISHASQDQVSVRYATVDGTAEAESDYESAVGIVLLPPGETTETVTVSVTGDTLFESEETFTVSLYAASNSAIADAEGICTVHNDDPPPGEYYGLFVGSYKPFHWPELWEKGGTIAGYLPNDPYADARGLAEALDRWLGFTEVADAPLVMELEYETAEVRDVADAFDEIAPHVTEQDTFIFYYSGHGATGDGLADPLFHGLQVLSLGAGGQELWDDTLADWLSTLPAASRKLVIIDSCYSGGFWPDALSDVENAVLMASAGEYGFSVRYPPLHPWAGRGIYTSWLIKGLADQSGNPGHAVADEDADGLTSGELHDWARRKMLFDDLPQYFGDELPVSGLLPVEGVTRWTSVDVLYEGESETVGDGGPAVANASPTADAGPVLLAGPGDLVTLSGLASHDPEGDAITYSWVQTSGATVVLSDPTSATPSFSAPAAGSCEELVFELTVSDGTAGSTDSATVRMGGITYVDPDAPGANDGSSWADAYHDLQDALAAARVGGIHEIWVAEGVYTPGSTRSDTFELVPGVGVYGGFGGYGDGEEAFRHERDWVAHPTILSGDLNGDDDGYDNMGENAEHVVTGVRAGLLDGVTITRGNGYEGAGLYLDSGGMTLRNTTLIRNHASSGGAVWIAYTTDQPVTLETCLIVGNHATLGGGIAAYGDVSIVGCTFAENSAIYGDAVWANGAGDVAIRNSIVWDWGGAIDEGAVYRGTTTVDYSCVIGGWTEGVGNIDVDPLFVDGAVSWDPGGGDGDFHLRPGSPCIDAADGASADPHDGEGDARYDDPLVANTGTGTPDYTDMGALEYGGELADLTISGLDYAPGTYERGESIGLSFTEANVGGLGVGPSPAFGTELRLSTDHTWGNADDVVIGSATEDHGLAAGAARLVTALGTVPLDAPTGNYYLALRADAADVVPEPAGDNALWSAAADVFVPDTTPPQGIYEVWGGNTDYRDDDHSWAYYYNIDEQDYVKLGEATGDASFAGDYDYYVIVSRGPILLDAIQGANGEYMGGRATGATGNVSDFGNLHGAPDGQYALLGAGESPDNYDGFLVFDNIDWVTGHRVVSGIRIITNHAPDLIAGRPESRWLAAHPEEEIEVGMVVRNQGSVATGSGYRAALFISTDDQVDLSDNEIASVSLSFPLAGGQTDTFPVAFDAPSTPGVYYLSLLADADDAVPNESFEDNNWGPTIQLVVGTGDFEVDLTRIRYNDGTGRVIDYDFSAGTSDPEGRILIPDSAILGRPGSESDADYYWLPMQASQQLNTSQGVATLRAFDGGAYLSADDPNAGADGTWAFEATLDRFADMGETGRLYAARLGMAPSPSASVWVEPELWAGWFTGVYEGEYYEGVLAIGMSVETSEGTEWEADLIGEFGLDPLSDSVALKLEATNGNQVTGYYRVPGKAWTSVGTFTDGNGELLSYSDYFPYVWLDVEDVSISPDRYEPNESMGAAAALAAEGGSQSGLTIHEPGDQDWFAWTAPAAGTLDVMITFSQEDGNLDLFVLDAAATLVGSGTSTTDDETVTLEVAQGQTYYVQVLEAASETHPGYDLTLDLAERSTAPATPDLTAAADTGVSNDDDLTYRDNNGPANALWFEVGGTLPGAVVTIYVDGQARGSAVATGPLTTVATVGDFDLVDGQHVVTAAQTEPDKLASTTSASLTVTVDTSPPSAPSAPDLVAASDTGVYDNDNVTKDDTPTFALSAGPFFRVYRGDQLASDAYASGSSCTVAVQPDGTHEFRVASVDSAGNEQLGPVLTVTIDTQPPVVTVDARSTPDVTPPVTGLIDDATARVTVTVASSPYGEGIANNGVTWLLPDGMIDPSLAPGQDYDVLVEAEDSAGNIGVDGTTNELHVIGVSSPGALVVDTVMRLNGRLNPTAIGPGSMSILALGTNGNPASFLYALQIGTDPNARWLRSGDAQQGQNPEHLYADGTAPQWFSAAELVDKRLLGLSPGAVHDFYAKVSNGQGAETEMFAVGSFATSLAGDVNRSGYATALDYAYIKAAILRGGVLGETLSWALDVNGDGFVDVLDLTEVRDRALNPTAPADLGQQAADTPAVLPQGSAATPVADPQVAATSAVPLSNPAAPENAAQEADDAPAASLLVPVTPPFDGEQAAAAPALPFLRPAIPQETGQPASLASTEVDETGIAVVLDLCAVTEPALSLAPLQDVSDPVVGTPDVPLANQFASAYAQPVMPRARHHVLDRDRDGDYDRDDIAGLPDGVL